MYLSPLHADDPPTIHPRFTHSFMLHSEVNRVHQALYSYTFSLSFILALRGYCHPSVRLMR
ncbi:hypothetical protein C8Q74DRAFT_727148 [Fomes fomentarius]|nr:hypothetical protein C8Q74DRAFT_727148 [Fomes fomentarius]